MNWLKWATVAVYAVSIVIVVLDVFYWRII